MLLPVLPGLAAASPDLIDDARALFDDRRYAEAQLQFEALHEADPEQAEVLWFLGKLAAKRQERVIAIDYLGRALELRPDDAAYHFEYGAACGRYAGTLGTSFKALTLARRASKSMNQAIALDPDNLTYRHGLIEFSLKAPAFAGGGSERAHAQADEIARRDPTKGAFAHAAIYRAEKNYAAALTTLAKLIALTPDNYFALFDFGRCAAESGLQLAAGKAHLQTCLTLPVPHPAPPPAQVWWNIATIEKQLGNRLAALAALETAAALAPQDRGIAEDLAQYTAKAM